MIDVHAHILPGVDDGPDDMEETFEMCRLASEDGIDSIVAAPHMNRGDYDAQKETVLSLVSTVNNLLEQKGIRLIVLPGADVRVSEDLCKRLERGEILTLNNRNSHILVEFPDYGIIPNFETWIFHMQTKGITPIFTHPERNHLVRGNIDLLYRWVELGALIQLTSYSLLGFFGKEVKRFSEELIKRRLVHLVGSDAHSRKMPPLLSEAYEVTSKLSGKEYAERIFKEYPKAVLSGKRISPEKPVRRQ